MTTLTGMRPTGDSVCKPPWSLPLMAGFDRQLRLLGAYGIFTYPFACIPFLFFYFKDHGIELDQYMVLIAWYYWAMVLMEIPTGVLADRFGRRILPRRRFTHARPRILHDLRRRTGFSRVLHGRDSVRHRPLPACPAHRRPCSSTLWLERSGRATSSSRRAGFTRLRLFGTGGSFLAGGLLAYFCGIDATILLTGALLS